MKCSKALIWSIIHGTTHNSLPEQERTPESYQFLITTVFPGIAYPTVSDLLEIKKQYLKEVLSQQFTEIVSVQEEDLNSGEVEVKKFLASDGCEWKTEAWQREFKKVLAT